MVVLLRKLSRRKDAFEDYFPLAKPLGWRRSRAGGEQRPALYSRTCSAVVNNLRWMDWIFHLPQNYRTNAVGLVLWEHFSIAGSRCIQTGPIERWKEAKITASIRNSLLTLWSIREPRSKLKWRGDPILRNSKILRCQPDGKVWHPGDCKRYHN